ncbi:MAG: PP2C family protein-serine/threonine phosphatase [Acidobacteriia bacterium]|nr:PP2C family protein-serine/threonine phosphatase [Terriglobia bacterium]
MNRLTARAREIGKRVTRLDAAALGFVAAGAVAQAVGLGTLGGILKFAGVVAAGYLAVRLAKWSRERVLWSLRSRLIVAYLFIAVVPVLLLMVLAVLAGQILYSQLGAYLLYEDVQSRLELMQSAAESLAGGSATGVAARADLPGLHIDYKEDTSYLQQLAGERARSFAGIVQTGGQLRLTVLRRLEGGQGAKVVELGVPVTGEFLETLAPELGPVQVTVAQRVEAGKKTNSVRIGEADYRAVGRVATRRRALQAAEYWVDPVIEGFSKLEATYVAGGERVERGHPVFAFFKARPSQLNRRIFSSLGELSRGKLLYFQMATVFLLLIEAGALVTGIILTRAITGAVDELYRATQHVQAGDLTYRVKVERRDQLGVLGDSFNKMTHSINQLIAEQRQLQNLENEISIAREVQAQLFPRKMPAVPGVELEAACRAARVVSGDYYDFIQMGPSQVAMVVADISGKGISAALLMASLQAALRSQALLEGSGSLSTAEVVSRLNRHLVRNTSEDRFATLFLAVYDSTTRRLRYTNAGHLPAVCIAGGVAQRLEAGGMVLGVVEDYRYEEGELEAAPGTLLIGYSDGLVEPENEYGEEFGMHRLEAEAMRRQGAGPREIAEALMNAADEWAGAGEQADDMTVIVARLG